MRSPKQNYARKTQSSVCRYTNLRTSQRMPKWRMRFYQKVKSTFSASTICGSCSSFMIPYRHTKHNLYFSRYSAKVNNAREHLSNGYGRTWLRAVIDKTCTSCTLSFAICLFVYSRPRLMPGCSPFPAVNLPAEWNMQKAAQTVDLYFPLFRFHDIRGMSHRTL